MVYTVVLEATAVRIESSSLSLGTIIQLTRISMKYVIACLAVIFLVGCEENPKVKNNC